MTKMKPIESEFGGLDLSNWNIFDTTGAAKELDNIIAAQLTKVLQAMFRNYPPLLEFVPFEYKTRSAKPPLMLAISLPLGEPGDYGVDYSCSFEAVVDELIETMLDPGQDSPEICAEVAARLRELADELDKASSK